MVFMDTVNFQNLIDSVFQQKHSDQPFENETRYTYILEMEF